MADDNAIQKYLEARPKESIQLAVLLIAFIWQSVPTILGLLCYLFLKRVHQINLFMIGLVAICLFFAASVFQEQGAYGLNVIIDFLYNGWLLNKISWQGILRGHASGSFSLLMSYCANYLIGVPLMVAFILNIIDQLPSAYHATTLLNLQKGKLSNNIKQYSVDEVKNSIRTIKDQDYSSTVLGISYSDCKPVVVPDHYLNHGLLVVGTTGSGKSVTLRRFYQHAIRQGLPLIIVNGKPTDQEVSFLMNWAIKRGRKFYGFNCGEFNHYDPLANGGYTELKDKIICLKDHWANEYYQSIAEDYLQTALAVLLQHKQKFDLQDVASTLEYKKLLVLAKEAKNEELFKQVQTLSNYEKNDISGLQAHLHVLTHSELGKYFTINEKAFSLKRAINENAVVYFALPALKFPSFAKILGKLVINDLKTVIANDDRNRKLFVAFDEFSVFASEQVLNIINMGREKGMHSIFATQGLADLEKVSPTFKNQLFNCINTLICHRVNDQISTKDVTDWIGTHSKLTVTAQIDLADKDKAMGTVRANKEFIVHPDQLKQELGQGDAFYISKVNGFHWDKVRVKC